MKSSYSRGTWNVPVSDRDDSGLSKIATHEISYDRVTFSIDGGGGFVHNDERRAAKQRTRYYQQLTLSDAEVTATFSHWIAQGLDTTVAHLDFISAPASL
jgi:N-methylhydantoinase B/oxoprolinase/acetone carboxylase alpha subunit